MVADLLIFSGSLIEVPSLFIRPITPGHAEPRTTGLYDRRKQKVTRKIVERISIDCKAGFYSDLDAFPKAHEFENRRAGLFAVFIHLSSISQHTVDGLLQAFWKWLACLRFNGLNSFRRRWR